MSQYSSAQTDMVTCLDDIYCEEAIILMYLHHINSCIMHPHTTDLTVPLIPIFTHNRLPSFLAQLISCAITNCPVRVIGGGIGGGGSVLGVVDRLLICKSYAYTVKQKSKKTL